MAILDIIRVAAYSITIVFCLLSLPGWRRVYRKVYGARPLVKACELLYVCLMLQTTGQLAYLVSREYKSALGMTLASRWVTFPAVLLAVLIVVIWRELK